MGRQGTPEVLPYYIEAGAVTRAPGRGARGMCRRRSSPRRPPTGTPSTQRSRGTPVRAPARPREWTPWRSSRLGDVQMHAGQLAQDSGGVRQWATQIIKQHKTAFSFHFVPMKICYKVKGKWHDLC